MIPSVFMCLDKFLNDQLYNIDKKYNEAHYNGNENYHLYPTDHF